MSTNFDSIDGDHNDVSRKQRRIYYRVQSPFPGINIWLTPEVGPEARKGNESATADTSNTKGLRFCKRMMGLGAKKTVTAAHSPRSTPAPATNNNRVSPTDGLETSTHNTAYQLTELEKNYLEYVKRGIGRDEFANYRLPAH